MHGRGHKRHGAELYYTRTFGNPAAEEILIVARARQQRITTRSGYGQLFGVQKLPRPFPASIIVTRTRRLRNRRRATVENKIWQTSQAK